MNICFITEEFPPETNWGGMATCFLNHARGLDMLGHRIFVITRGVKASSYKYPGTHIQVFRISPKFDFKILNYFYFKFPLGLLRKTLSLFVPEFLSTLEWNFFAYLCFKKLKLIHQIDIVHTPEYHLGGLFISLFEHYPVSVYLIGGKMFTVKLNMDKESTDVRLLDILEKIYIKKHKDRILALSQNIGHYTEETLLRDQKIPVIYPSVDIDLFHPEPTARQTHPFLLFVGRLERRKGTDLLLAAFCKIATKYPKLHLLYIGRDTYTFNQHTNYVNFKTIFNSMVKDRDIRNRINFIEHVNYEQLTSFYQKSLFCVFPSLYEPFGLVALEAMSCGKAVITTKYGGPAEFIQQRVNGILIHPTLNNLVHTLNVLLSNSHLRKRIASLAPQVVERNFNLKTIGKQLENYYYAIIT